MATGDVTLAWQAADTLGTLASPGVISLVLWPGAVEEVAQLLQVGAGRVTCNIQDGATVYRFV